MLMIGNATPDLKVEALMPDGRFERLRLGALLGRWAVLFFYPKDFTFVCPTEIRGYEALASRFREADAALLGASVDSVHVHRAWVEHGLGKVSFPLIGDVTRRLAQAFGVLLDDEGVAARATFILDPEGRIASVTAARTTCTSPPGRTARPMVSSAACTSWMSEGRGYREAVAAGL